MLGCVSLALTGCLSARAADLAYEPPPRYAPPPLISWTGLFFGVNAGYSYNISPFITPAQDHVQLRAAAPVEYRIAATAVAAGNQSLSAPTSGFAGGVQLGYDWQAGGLVIGAETDIQGMSNVQSKASGAVLFDVPGGGGFRVGAFTQGMRSLNYLGTLRLRVGYLAMPTLLLYGTAGLAYGSVSGDYGVLQAYGPPPLAPFATASWSAEAGYSKIAVGLAAGFGAEWMIFPSVSIKGEYLYYGLGSVATPLVAQRDPTGVVLGPAWVNFSRAYTRYEGQLFRVGLNIRFSEQAPLAPPPRGPIYARY
jgi:outer membrane immunogenic protein